MNVLQIRPFWAPFRSVRNIFFLLGVLLLCSCMNAEDKPLKWTEDVQLPDGRVVTLTRYQEFKGPHELGDMPTESDYWFEFKHPDTGEVVRWQSDRDLSTLALFMQNSKIFLLTKPQFGSSEFRYGCPNPPYLLFVLENAQWKQVSLKTIPLKRIRVNLTFDAKYQRQVIRSFGLHLNTNQTQSSEHEGRPFIINFERLFEQTFDTQINCDRPRNYLTD
jgi:hypothetical protein